MKSIKWLLGWLVPTVLLSWFGFWWIGVIYTLLMVFPVIFWGLAEDNIFFTSVSEGTAKIVTRAGAFDKVLLRWKGHKLNEEGDVIKGELAQATFLQRVGKRFGGLVFYGWWPLVDILLYTMEWWGVSGEGKVDFHPRQSLDTILVRPDLFWGEVRNAEDKNLLPLTIGFVFTLRVVNPRRALFDIQNYLEVISERLKSAVRDRVTNSSYEELVMNVSDMAKEIFAEISGLRSEFIERYGVEVATFDIKDIDPPDAYREQTTAAYTATQEAKRIVIKREAEAKGIILINDAIEKYGDLGITIRALQALEESPLAASVVVQQIPGLKEALNSLGKSEGDLSEKELRDLLGDLKNILQEIKGKEE